MAFGDVKETVTDSVGFAGGPLSATYSSATPVAGDLNVACYFVEAPTDPSMPVPDGYSQASFVLDVANDEEGHIWYELVADASDDNISVASTPNEAGVVLTLFEGEFESSPLDLSVTDNDALDNSDPVATGASGSSTAQAAEVMVALVTQRNVTDREGVDASQRQGTATPTGDMSDTGTVGMTTTLRVYQNHQVLTGVGTVGVSRQNANTYDLMVAYATFKKVPPPPPPGGLASTQKNSNYIIHTSEIVAVTAEIIVEELDTSKTECYCGLQFFSDAAGTSPVTPSAGTAVVSVRTVNTHPEYEALAGGGSIDATAPTTQSWDGNTRTVRVVPSGISGANYYRAVVTCNEN